MMRIALSLYLLSLMKGRADHRHPFNKKSEFKIIIKSKLFALLVLFLPSHSALAIDMPLYGIDGSVQNLSEFEGSWVIVNYWATWCPPCIAEMPDLQAFHNANIDKGAMVIGINTENLPNAQLQDFLENYFITYPVYRGSMNSNTELGTIPGLPTTFLVSPLGEVEARHVGTVTSEIIENFIQKWEAKQQVITENSKHALSKSDRHDSHISSIQSNR